MHPDRKFHEVTPSQEIQEPGSAGKNVRITGPVRWSEPSPGDHPLIIRAGLSQKASLSEILSACVEGSIVADSKSLMYSNVDVSSVHNDGKDTLLLPQRGSKIIIPNKCSLLFRILFC